MVVDDAIVVVENVERNMTKVGLRPKQATIKAMEEIGTAHSSRACHGISLHPCCVSSRNHRSAL